MNAGELRRPGARLLETFLGADLRGKPGPARKQAIAAAKRRRASAPWHLLDAAYASLLIGEPRAASKLLDQLVAVTAGDLLWARRVTACRAWAFMLDRNWYPGDVGSELDVEPVTNSPAYPVPSEGDDETVMLEALVAWGPVAALRSRALLDGFSSAPRARAEFLQQSMAELACLEAVATERGAAPAAFWANLAAADFSHRCGEFATADLVLRKARRTFASDPLALATSFLLEGDWWANPGSTPEALGLQLRSNPPLPLERADLPHAARCYRRAEQFLVAMNAPRAAGALALRHSVLAWHRNRYQQQARFLSMAERSFSEAGDRAALWLVEVHRLINEMGDGKVASTRLRAGTGWSLASDGLIARLLKWSDESGSVSYCVGLGRLLQRAGARWAHAGKHEEAVTALAMAEPLIALIGPHQSASVLVELARVELKFKLGVRATARLQQALGRLADLTDALNQRLDWLRQIETVLSIINAHLDADRTASGLSISGLVRATDRLRTLLELPGVPKPAETDALPSLDQQQLEIIAGTRKHDDLDRLLAESDKTVTERERRMLTLAAGAARSMLSSAEALRQFHLGVDAARSGDAATAEEWWESAVKEAEANRRNDAWVIPFLLAGSGKYDNAQARVEELKAAGMITSGDLPDLVFMTRHYNDARRLFREIDGEGGRESLGWQPLLSRLIAELEEGSLDVAVEIARRAIVKFESRVFALKRDPDRIAVCDDINAVRLYLAAARAWLERGNAFRQAGDGARYSDAIRRAFTYADRSRSITLETLVVQMKARGSQAALVRRWQSAANNWQANCDRLHSGYVNWASDSELQNATGDLAVSDRVLTSVEAEIERMAPRLMKPHVPALPSLPAIQAALPPETALIEFQFAEEELLVLAVTRKSTVWHHRKIDRHLLFQLVLQVHQACVEGVKDLPADDLSALLLGPLAGVLDECNRLVIVPYGPLHTLSFGVLPLGGRLIGETHVLSYLPAATLLQGRRLDLPLSHSDVVAVGDPAFDPRRHPGLRRLDGARIEAASVARIWGATAEDLLIGEKATRKRVLKAIQSRSIVHLAAHGLLDSVAPTASALVLSGRSQLTVGDLIEMRPGTELVVLSACDSGQGARTLGGDVVGLTRGLLAAGVRRSVVSFWAVDDIATCCLMTTFHEQLAAAKPPAFALAAAQADLRRLSSHELVERYGSLGGDVKRIANRNVLDGNVPRSWAAFGIVGC